MTTAVQHRRGTTAEHSTFTGLEGEVTIDTTKDTAVIHDGVLAGGYPLAKENLANVNPSGLSSITGAATASDDRFFIYDQSATSLKTITRAELNNAMEQDALANVSITGGTINGTAIGGTTAAAGAFTTLSASGAVTLSGGTANGVPYLNGSKVLTTGSALTFNGSNLFIPTGGIESGGAAAAGSFAAYNTDAVNAQRIIVSMSGTNAVFNATRASGTVPQMLFQIDGSEQMRLTSTGLGIGTSSPQAKLDVAGTAKPSNATNKGDIIIQQSGTALAGNGGLEIVVDSAASGYGARIQSTFNGSSAYDLSFQLRNNSASWTQRMLLDSSGNLGLGVTPSAWASGSRAMQITNGLSLWSNGANTATFGQNYVFNGTNSLYVGSFAASVYQQQNGAHQWFTAPSGTAGAAISFTQAMDLANSSGASTLTVNSALNTASAVRLTTNGGLTAGMFLAAPTIDHSLGFQTAGTEKMRLTSAGNLGIGTTSPATRLHIDTASAGYGLTLAASSLTGRTYRFGLDSNANLALFDSTAAAVRLTLDTSGNLGLGVTPSAWSGTRAIEIPNGGFLGSAGGALGVIANGFFNGTSYIYKLNGTATNYIANSSGRHEWYTAPSGTAGNAITFTQAMTLNGDRRLQLNTTTFVGNEQAIIGFDSSGTITQALNTRDTNASANNNSHIVLRRSDDAYLGALGRAGTDVAMFVDSQTYLSLRTAATERARIDSSGNLIQSAPTTPPTLATNGTMVFNLTSNTNLRVSVRGSDGVTRTANITLA